MPDERLPTIGRCYACKRTFHYDPATVTMFLVDPETGFPPGMTVLGGQRDPAPESVQRAEHRPVCPRCVEQAERHLAAQNPPEPRFPTWP